jgi:hypothetical protein
MTRRKWELFSNPRPQSESSNVKRSVSMKRYWKKKKRQ